jgi:hypothetical protein
MAQIGPRNNPRTGEEEEEVAAYRSLVFVLPILHFFLGFFLSPRWKKAKLRRGSNEEDFNSVKMGRGIRNASGSVVAFPSSVLSPS